MDQVVPESPGGGKCKFLKLRQKSYVAKAEGRDASSFPFFFFLLFKIPLSKPKTESQAMWAVFVFQGLSALPCPQCWQRLAGAVGQIKLHKTKMPMAKP